MRKFLARSLGLVPFHRTLRDLRTRRRQRIDHARWEAAGRPMPPPHLAKQLALREIAREHGLRILVETGTYHGDMVEALRRDFERVFSIELGEDLHRRAVARFLKVRNVRLVQGDSAAKLPEIVAELDRPALFWLDGHYSAGITARGDEDTPVFKELDAILQAPDLGHVIVIDDARDFGTDPAYPTLEQIRERVLARWPDRVFCVENDAIRILPGATPKTDPNQSHPPRSSHEQGRPTPG